MTTIPVWGLVYYLTQTEGMQWRQQDWDAMKVTKTLKGESINGYFDLKVGPQWRRFDNNNKAEFIPPLLAAVARYFQQLNLGDYCIVPIPNSHATIQDRAPFRTLELAQQLVKSLTPPPQIVPALRWKTAKQPAHKGGTRDPQILFDNLAVVERPTKPIVLFDDVRTMGSQIIASTRRLREAGFTVLGALVVSKVVWEQRPEMFAWSTDQLEIDAKPISLEDIF